MSKSKGRPKQKVRRGRHIGFNVTAKDFVIIQKKMDAAHTTISEYMRDMAVNGKVQVRWTDERWEAVKELIAISSALNRLGDLVGELGCEGVAAEFVVYRDMMDKFLNQVYAR